jgi:arabinofuranosyltransferase
VLAVAALGCLGINLVVAAGLLGYAGMLGAMTALVWLLGPQRRGSDSGAIWASLFGVIAMGLSAPLAIWAVGGLEQGLLVGLIAWATVLLASGWRIDGSVVAASNARLLAVGGLLGIACWTRPDAPIFVACAALALLAAPRPPEGRLRGVALVVAPAFVLILLQLAFRLAYYGDWLPNTAHSKLAFTTHRVQEGLAYWRGGMGPLAGLWIPALGCAVTALIRPSLRPRVLVFGLPLIAWSAWVIVIGGDIFPGRRHLVVVVVLMALLAAELWRAAWQSADGRVRAGLTAGMLGCLIALGIGQWSHDRAHLRARHEVAWAQRGESLGRVLGQSFADTKPLLAVSAAGALPYYSKLPALDMLGLNDRYLAKHPPADLGQGRIGHELGDGDYTLRREPDLVIFCGTAGAERACSRGGREMQADPRFLRDYELVTLLGEWPVPVHGKVWVRTASPRIGLVVHENESWEIPGLLLNQEAASLAGLDAEGRVGALVFADQPATRTRIRLPGGHFRLALLGSGDLRVRVDEHAAPQKNLAAGRPPIEFALAPPGAEIDVVVETDDDDAHARRVQIDRVTPAAERPFGAGTGS